MEQDGFQIIDPGVSCFSALILTFILKRKEGSYGYLARQGLGSLQLVN